jgi:hypothetical protein
MRTLIVGYDLNRAGQQYQAVWDYLRAQPNWWHNLDSTWVIRTELTARQVRDEIVRIGLDSNDELLVAELTGTAAWRGFTSTGSDWLADNL